MFLHAADFGNHYGNLVHINNYIKQGILPNADAINSNNLYNNVLVIIIALPQIVWDWGVSRCCAAHMHACMHTHARMHAHTNILVQREGSIGYTG